MRLVLVSLTAVIALTVPAPAQERLPELEADLRRVTLEEAIETALARSPALSLADADRDATAADRLAARGAFLPSADLSYNYLQSNTGRLDPTGQEITRTSHAFQVSGSYELFDGWRRFRDLAAAAKRLDAEDATYREERYGTILAVKQAYFAAVAARDLARVEADRVARLEDQLEFVRRQLALGRATRSDELRSSVDLNNAKLALLNAEFEVRESAFELARVAGVDEPLAPSAEASLELEPVEISRDEVMALALADGPSVVATQASTDAAEAAAASARSAYWPSLALSAGQSWRDDAFPPDDGSWSLRLVASYPLFNGLQRESAVQRANARVRAAEASQRSVELALRTDVDAAYNQLALARAGIELATETVDLAREDLRVTEERYRVRLVTILDLQAAQIALREAEVERIQRRFDHAIAVARLEALLGRTFE